MNKFKIRPHYIHSAKNYVKCRVCNRRPKSNRNGYEITADIHENGFTMTAHHGFTDTRKCAEFYVVSEMGK